jgi:hypothetical protein
MEAILLWTVLAGLDSTGAMTTAEIARLNATLERAKQVQVVSGAGAFEVSHPRARHDGLDWDSTPGTSLRRPSIAPEDMKATPVPPRPIPWSSIETIKWRRSGTGTGVGAGLIGAAAILTGAAFLINASGSDVAPSPVGIVFGSLAGGALIGVVAAGIASRTEVVYSPPARAP